MEAKTFYGEDKSGVGVATSGKPLPSPGAGEVLRYTFLLSQGRVLEIFDHLVARYGPLVRIHIPDYPFLRPLARRLTGLPLKSFVIAAGRDANQLLMTSDYHTVQRRPIEVRGFPLDESGAARNRCVVALDGPMQKYFRRFLFEPFGNNCLASYIPLIEYCALRRAQTWGNELPLFDEMVSLAVEICALTMLGIEPETEALAEFSAHYWPVTMGLRNRRSHEAKQAMRALLMRLIQQRTEQPGQDALSALVQAARARYSDITQEDLLHYGFMLAEVGQSDIAIFLTYLLSELALHSELSERLLTEFTAYSPESLLNAEKALPLTTSVLREVERLYPPVPYLFRYAAQDTQFGDYHIPGDSWLISAMYTTHRLSGLFHNPLQFDPDRFLPPRNEPASRFAVMGFGAGVHSCVGMPFVRLLAGVVVYTLLRLYRFKLTNRDSLPEIDYRGRCQKPREAITLAVSKR